MSDVMSLQWYWDMFAKTICFRVNFFHVLESAKVATENFVMESNISIHLHLDVTYVSSI